LVPINSLLYLYWIRLGRGTYAYRASPLGFPLALTLQILFWVVLFVGGFFAIAAGLSISWG
jgi:hypothetical protein